MAAQTSKPFQNDVTNAYMRSKVPTDEYREGWDHIFGDKPKSDKPETDRNGKSTT